MPGSLKGSVSKVRGRLLGMHANFDQDMFNSWLKKFRVPNYEGWFVPFRLFAAEALYNAKMQVGYSHGDLELYISCHPTNLLLPRQINICDTFDNKEIVTWAEERGNVLNASTNRVNLISFSYL